jgi:hypothetical protein
MASEIMLPLTIVLSLSFPLTSATPSFVPSEEGEPNPPVWPASVAVFGPSDKVDTIEAKLQAAFKTNGGHSPSNNGQFSDSRFAFLFKPGEYDVDAPVGYYTQILGLGSSPNDVHFTSPKGVYCEEGDYSIGGALSTFWRSAENFRTSASFKWAVGAGMTWAVSQVCLQSRLPIFLPSSFVVSLKYHVLPPGCAAP